MEIKIKYGKICSESVLKSLSKISETPFDNIQPLLNITKVIKQVDERYKQFNELRDKIVKKYCDKDNQGEPKIKNENEVVVTDKENIKKINKLILELSNTEVDLEFEKIKIKDIINKIKLTPNDLILLDWLFEN